MAAVFCCHHLCNSSVTIYSQVSHFAASHQGDTHFIYDTFAFVKAHSSQ